MNILNACATYTGHVDINGRVLARFIIPGGNKTDIPIFVDCQCPAAKNSLDEGAYEKGTNLLLEGRIYFRILTPQQKENKEWDDRLYVVPTGPLQIVPDRIRKNRVDLAGGVGYVEESKSNENVINFGLVCTGISQGWLNVGSFNKEKRKGVALKIAAWDKAADQLRSLYPPIGKGNALKLALGGTLTFRSYTDKEGNTRCQYPIQVKSNQLSTFTAIPNKEYKEEKKSPNNTYIPETPHEAAIAVSSVEVTKDKEDDIPF